jgi:hypothetical protein
MIAGRRSERASQLPRANGREAVSALVVLAIDDGDGTHQIPDRESVMTRLRLATSSATAASTNGAMSWKLENV